MKSTLKNRVAQAGVRLLKTPETLPGESLMGYILRLTEANYYESPQWILDLAGLKFSGLNPGWRILCRERTDLAIFSRITGLNADEIAQLKHQILTEGEFHREVCQAHQGLPLDDIDFKDPQVCVECLRESGHCRKLWDLKIMTVCPRHRVKLLDQCSACGLMPRRGIAREFIERY